MHDPGGKNRFSKLSYVEPNCVGFVRATVNDPFPSFLSLVLSLFHLYYTGWYNSESGDTMTTSGSRKEERIYRSGEFVRFIYREIFSGPAVRTERPPEVISRLYCEMNFDDALLVREISPPTKLLPRLFPLTSEFGGTGPGRSVFSQRTISARTRCPRNPSSFSVIPISIPFLYVYCRSSHCASYERICETTVSNELPDRKLGQQTDGTFF